jgi:inner membrane transporter RhtA
VFTHVWIIVTAPASFKPASLVLTVGVLIAAMLSFQVGAAVAKQLFPLVGAAGTTALRLGLSSVMLLAAWRPWRIRPSAREARMIVVYGLSMGIMNLCFYESLNHIPLGIAVALEFTGPLGVAVATSRRLVDFLWIGLAAIGLAALLPLGFSAAAVDAVGVAFALTAAVCWAIYILSGQKAGSAHGGQTAALGTVIAAMVVVPIGFGNAGTALLSPGLLPLGCAVAVLSSALPYSLEIYAMTRLPTRTFGVLMSGDPALAALSGLVFLGEKLTVIQWSAVACIVLASAGIAVTSRAAPQAASQPLVN